MKYLCLVYSDERLLHSLPESPKDEECMAYAESIQGSGRMVAAEALESVQTATTVRMRHGNVFGQQGEPLDPRAGFGQQRVQRTVDVAGEFDLFRMHFDGLDLLALQRVQAFIRHESGCHWRVLFPTENESRILASLAIWIIFISSVDSPDRQTTKGVFQ